MLSLHYNKACGCHHERIVLLDNASGVTVRSAENHLNIAFRQDPTRTKTLREGFVRACTKRFRQLAAAIKISIVDNDCFGLMQSQAQTARLLLQSSPVPAQAGQFAFTRTAAKVEAFMDWLNLQEEAGILEIIHRPGALRGFEEAWTDTWVHSAYQKGVLRARQELRAQDPTIPALDASFSGLNAVMNQPIHADRLGALYTRTFSELKGVDAAMDQQISRILTQGLIDGKNPRVLAKDLLDVFELNGSGTATGIRAIYRARMVARTEIIRAHHVANIAEYKQWGAQGVMVQVEWTTAGFNVCPECSSLAGKIFTLDQIAGLIPKHPNCRCVAIPVLRTQEEQNA